LLWVYGPNHGAKTAAYYPGDRYVDLGGLDAYTDFVDRQHITGYDEVIAWGSALDSRSLIPTGRPAPR